MTTQHVPTTSGHFDETRIIERPDGIYWQSKDDGREHGPYSTLIEAVADMEAADGGNGDEGALLAAEEMLGVPGWIDPETGELADDEHIRIEDH